MANRHSIVFSFLSAAFVLGASAQTDNVVEVENDYQPTVKDADKINTLPEIEETKTSHYIVNYTTTAIPTNNYAFQPMWAAQNKQLIRSDKKGFITLGYGTNSNSMGRFAYGFDFTDNDKLNVDISTRGHKCDVDRVYETGSWNSRFFTNRFRADYEHHINSLSSLILNASYGTDVFNYQPSYYNTATSAETDKQHNELFDAAVKLTPLSFGNFFIGAEASVSSFQQKHATNAADEYSEILLNGSITPGYKVNKHLAFDVRLNVDNTSYGIKTMDGYSQFDISPHIYYSNELLDMKLGAYINTEKEIAPDVDVTIHFAPQIEIYAMANGGTVYNSFSRLSQMTPYWTLNDFNAKVRPRFDQLRARGGIRTKPFEGLSVGISAGYELSERRAEIASFMMKSDNAPLLYSPIIFEDGKRLYGAIDIDFNYKNIIIAKINGEYNSWSSDYEWAQEVAGNSTRNYDKVESWRPVISASSKIEIRPVEELSMGVNLLFQSFKYYANLYERPNSIDLGATVSYTFPCRLTLYAKGDNLLNRKFDQYTMYGSPEMSFLFGAAYTF